MSRWLSSRLLFQARYEVKQTISNTDIILIFHELNLHYPSIQALAVVPQSGSSTFKEVDGATMKTPVYKEAKVSLVRLQSGHQRQNILVDFSAMIRQKILTSTTGIWPMLSTAMVPRSLEMCKLVKLQQRGRGSINFRS